VKIAEVEVEKSGRMPITLMVKMPIGYNLETNIAPVVESTLIRSLPEIPAYFHVLAYVPQLRVAENGVIGKF
jgi:hypothetical protein